MRDTGFTLVELMIAIVVLGVLAVLATAGLVRARASANESSAVSALKSINMGQVSYNAACGRGGYAASLPVLGRPPHASSSAGYIDAVLATAAVVDHSGYRIQLQSGTGAKNLFADCNGEQTVSGYYASSVPVAFGDTGSRSFATSQVGVIWQNMSGTAPTEPFGAPSEVAK